MKSLFSVIVALLLFARSFACGWVEPSFRSYIGSTPHIIKGEIVKITILPKDTSKDYSYDQYLATVAITENIKGTIAEKTIEVPWYRMEANELNTPFIAYVQPDDSVGYNYMKITTGEPHELDIYQQRIEEMLALIQLADTAEKNRQTTEWMVRCAEHPITRKALRDLEVDGNHTIAVVGVRHRWDNSTPREDIPLTDDQQMRLKNILLQTVASLSLNDISDRENWRLLHLVNTPGDKEVKDYLVSMLENSRDAYQSQLLMRQISNTDNKNKQLSALCKKADNEEYVDDEDSDTPRHKQNILKLAVTFLAEAKKPAPAAIVAKENKPALRH